MRCYRRLLNISYKDHVTNEEVRNRIQNAIGVQDDHGKETETQIYGHWHGEDNSTGDIERSKERKTEEEMGK